MNKHNPEQPERLRFHGQEIDPAFDEEVDLTGCMAWAFVICSWALLILYWTR